MATKYEYYDSGDDAEAQAYGDFGGTFIILGMTFTAESSHPITSMKLLLYRSGSPGTLEGSIWETDGVYPTNEMAMGTTDGDTLPTGSPYEWREISLGVGEYLISGTVYALVLKAPSGDSSNKVLWRQDQSSPAYDGGGWCFIYTGYDWGYQGVPPYDSLFEVWSNDGGFGNPTRYSRSVIERTVKSPYGYIPGTGWSR